MMGSSSSSSETDSEPPHKSPRQGPDQSQTQSQTQPNLSQGSQLATSQTQNVKNKVVLKLRNASMKVIGM